MKAPQLQRLYEEHRQALKLWAESETAPKGELLRPVFGAGDPDRADVLLVGEAPGRFETEAGRPFVGKAGENLHEFLALSGIREDRLYVTNAVKYRPLAFGSKGTARNRTPTRKELIAGRELLLQEIEIIGPRLVVTLGNSPLYALTGKADIGSAHGALRAFEGRSLFPLYHPASLIYNPSLAETYQEDMQRLAQCIRAL